MPPIEDRRHPLLDGIGVPETPSPKYIPVRGSLLRVEPGPSSTARRTATNNVKMEMGVHPATRARLLVSAEPESCSGCAFAVRVARGRKSVWKCLRHRLGLSHSEASDIRISWPACTLFRPVEDREPCTDPESTRIDSYCYREVATTINVGTARRPREQPWTAREPCPTCRATGWLLGGRAWNEPGPLFEGRPS